MKIITLTERNEIEVLLEAVSTLKKGGTVVVPTDTVYGLAADAMDDRAVAGVFKIKGREEGKPVPVLVADFEMLDKVALASADTKARIQKFGSVTAVLPSRGWMPLNLRSKGLTIGVRIPDHPFLLRIINSFGKPVTGTSANLSGRSSHSDAAGVVADFARRRIKPDLVIDAGNLGERSPSVVVDFTKNPPQVLRTGPLSREALMELIGGKGDASAF